MVYWLVLYEREWSNSAVVGRGDISQTADNEMATVRALIMAVTPDGSLIPPRCGRPRTRYFPIRKCASSSGHKRTASGFYP